MRRINYTHIRLYFFKKKLKRIKLKINFSLPLYEKCICAWIICITVEVYKNNFYSDKYIIHKWYNWDISDFFLLKLEVSSLIFLNEKNHIKRATTKMSFIICKFKCCSKNYSYNMRIQIQPYSNIELNNKVKTHSCLT